MRFRLAARITFYSIILKKERKRESPCLKPRLVSKGSKMSFPILTALIVVLSVILHNRMNFARISNIDMAWNRQLLSVLSKVAL